MTVYTEQLPKENRIMVSPAPINIKEDDIELIRKQSENSIKFSIFQNGWPKRPLLESSEVSICKNGDEYELFFEILFSHPMDMSDTFNRMWFFDNTKETLKEISILWDCVLEVIEIMEKDGE